MDTQSNAIPSSNVGNLLSDEEMRVSLCLRLGTEIYHEHVCKCGMVCDRYAMHSFSCKKNNGKIIRHNIINHIFHMSLLSAGIPNALERNNLINSNNLRPDGITLIPFTKGKSLVWDVTFPHPLAPCVLQNFSRGKSANSCNVLFFHLISTPGFSSS